MCIFLLLIFEQLRVATQRSAPYAAEYCTVSRIQILGVCPRVPLYHNKPKMPSWLQT